MHIFNSYISHYRRVRWIISRYPFVGPCPPIVPTLAGSVAVQETVVAHSQTCRRHRISKLIASRGTPWLEVSARWRSTGKHQKQQQPVVRFFMAQLFSAVSLCPDCQSHCHKSRFPAVKEMKHIDVS